MRINHLLYFTAILLIVSSCNKSQKSTNILKQNDFQAAPIAEVIPDTCQFWENAYRQLFLDEGQKQSESN